MVAPLSQNTVIGSSYVVFVLMDINNRMQDSLFLLFPTATLV